MSVKEIKFPKKLIGLVLTLGTLLLSPHSNAGTVIFEASGVNPAAIQATVDAFRAAFGGANNGVGEGCFADGRREINWDGVPDGSSAPNAFPGNFFNFNSPRGVIFTTPGTGFQVSADSPPADVEFGNINASYPNTFNTFSAQRLFTPLGSNITEVGFFLPGTTFPAGSPGFGAVFTDVDLNVTIVDFFDVNDNLLLSQNVTTEPGDGNLSFLGVFFDSGELIARVEITTGTGALGPGDDPAMGDDMVVMDDFIYGEPQRFISIDDVTVMEPASGQINAVFTISLSGTACGDTTVDVVTADDTATSPADFTAAPLTTVTFLDGEQTKTVSIPVHSDSEVEGDETFFVNLSNSVGAALADDQGVGTIQDFATTPTPTPGPGPFPVGDLSGSGIGCQLGADTGNLSRLWSAILLIMAPMSMGFLRFRKK